MTEPGRYAHVRSDSTPATKAADDAADARAFGSVVRLQYGPVKIGVPAVLIGAAASWLVSRYALPAATADCASRGDVNAISKRVDEIANAQTALAQAMAKNADVAHNETQELRATVTRNADRSEGGIQRLSDKLDVFLRR